MPAGPDGVDPDELARAFDDTGARLFYAQPTYANPTGTQWSTERVGRSWTSSATAAPAGRGRLGARLRHHHTPPTVAAQDDAGHVVYLRSLTKSVSPALRVAAVIARGPARERILADRGAESMYVSGGN